MTRKCWSASIGERPYTVVVFEKHPGSALHMQWWDRELKRRRRKALGHRDQLQGLREAEAQSRSLQSAAPANTPTLGHILRKYEAHQLPRLESASHRKENTRRIALWRAVLGDHRDVTTLGQREWDAFVSARGAGVIDERGRFVEDPKARADVGPRTVDADIVFLISVFHWALTFRDAAGDRLLESNPWGSPAPGVKRAMQRPVNSAPKRPIADDQRVAQLLAIAPRVTMELPAKGKRKRARITSYFRDLLELTHETGHRITAVCRLQYDDVVRIEGKVAALRWRPIKGGAEAVVPLNDRAIITIKRILRARPGFGAQAMFPAPRNPAQSISRHFADALMRRAELIAELPHLDGGCWHPMRRKWATSRKHHATADVMKAGGWRDRRSLETSYQLTDDASVMAVVSDARRISRRA